MMAASNMSFYYGDLVINNSQSIETGEVLETDEFLNSDDEDEIEVEEQLSMKKDHIRVGWLDETGSIEKTALDMINIYFSQEVLPTRKAKLYDRPLYRGEVVRRVGSEKDQLGYCRSTSTTADVKVVGTQHVLTNINSADLERPENSLWVRTLLFVVRMHMKGWKIPIISFMLGIHLHLLTRRPLQIGTHQFLTMKDSYNLLPLREWKTLMAAKLNISSHRVVIPWKMSWTLKNVYTYGFGYLWGTISFLVSSSQLVLCCFDTNIWSKGLNGISFEFGGRLCFYYCMLQFLMVLVRSKTLKETYFETQLGFFSFLGLVALFLPIFHNKLDDYLNENTKYVAANLEDKYFNFLGYVFSCYCFIKSVMMLWSVVRRGLRRSLTDFAVLFSGGGKVLVPEEKLTVEILVTQTRADVVWQDGTVECNILSTNLYPAWAIENEHAFFPGNHVLGSEGSFADFPSYDYGVVKKVDRPGRTAIVKWMKINDAAGNTHPELVTEQEVSVYDIIRHPESGSNVIGVSSLEPSPDVGPNEDGPIVPIDQSPPEDPTLVEDGVAIQKEKGGANNLCPATSDSEHRNIFQQLSAILESSPPRLKMPCTEQGSEANEEQIIDVEEQSKVITERNVTVNENFLEQNNMPKTDLPEQGNLSMFESVPDSHKYKLSIFQPDKLGPFASIVRKEMDILKSSLPDGIVVKRFEDRIDLFSVLIKGPKTTPYEDGLFFFDLQLPVDYPSSPPLCHHVSYSKGRLNPNLYESGKVSVSLLDTFSGQGTQMWNKETSSLLQAIVSIQGLILVSEPYYNETGCGREKGTSLGNKKSRLYNEKVLLQIVEDMIELKTNPPELFQKEISDHFQTSKMVERLMRWVEISETWNTTSPESPSTSGKLHTDVISSQDEVSLPEFPLIPASKGFCLTLKKSIGKFKDIAAYRES